jgi:hypothetical protein
VEHPFSIEISIYSLNPQIFVALTFLSTLTTCLIQNEIYN